MLTILCMFLALGDVKKELPKEVLDVLYNDKSSVEFRLLSDDKEDGEAYKGKYIKKSALIDPSSKNEVIKSLVKALKDSDGIAPREFTKYEYAIHATSESTYVCVEILISFPERRCVVYLNGKQIKDDFRMKPSEDLKKLLDDILK